MTEPTDAELDSLLGEHWPAFATSGSRPLQGMRAAMRDAIARWGQPSGAGEPLIRQLVESLEGYRRNHNDTQPCDAERAGRARLEGKK